MTDGTTLVTFNAATGAIKWTRVFPNGGIRILPGPRNGVLHVAGRISEMLDEFGRPVK
jgi:predicted oxidoreductase